MESVLLPVQEYLVNLFTIANIISWLPWMVLPTIVHEFRHYAASRYYGATIKFKFSLGMFGPIPIPRFIWRHPDLPLNQLKVVCAAGFVTEFVIGFFMPLPYRAVAVLHLLLYKFYAGDNSDFSVFKKKC